MPWVADVRILVLPLIHEGGEQLREGSGEGQHNRVDLTRHDAPLDPLFSGWLGDLDDRHAVDRVHLEGVAHTLTSQIARCVHDATLGQIQVAKAGTHLKQRVQHVLHRSHSLAELVEHDDDRPVGSDSLTDLEAAVRCVISHHALLVHDRHSRVAKVKRLRVEGVSNEVVTHRRVFPEVVEHGALASAHLTANKEAVLGDRHDKLCGLLKA